MVRSISCMVVIVMVPVVLVVLCCLPCEWHGSLGCRCGMALLACTLLVVLVSPALSHDHAVVLQYQDGR